MATSPDKETIPAAAPVPSGFTQSYVDWPAVVAGAVLATAISFVLMTFGAGIGLSVVSPEPGEGLAPVTVLVGVGLWVLWVTVSSFMAGGYLAGRLRRRVPDASEHEVEIRDGSHGLVVWALGVLLGAVLLVAGSYGGARIGTATIQAAAEATPEQTKQAMMASTVDALLRADGKPVANREATAGEIRRILDNRTDEGKLADGDQAYLVQVIANRTALTEAQATERVAAVTSNLSKAEKAAADAAEAARKLGIFVAFLLAASLLIGGAGAWWSAGVGGRHRDEQTVFAFFVARR